MEEQVVLLDHTQDLILVDLDPILVVLDLILAVLHLKVDHHLVPVVPVEMLVGIHSKTPRCFN